MKKIFLGLVAAFSFTIVVAQNHSVPCITDEVTDEFFKNNPAQAEELKEKFYSDYEQYLQTENASTTRRKSGAVHIIPVVFHVIHTYGDENLSKATLENQMRILNENFRRLNASRVNTRPIFQGDAADCEIEFRLATKDPNGNCTDGITRTYSQLTHDTRDDVKSLIRWDNTKYLNVWVVAYVRPPNGNPDFVSGGFAYLPWSLPGTNAVDGIVVRADGLLSNSSSVLTHEVGHYLGLNHTFNNGCGGSNCATSGDRVCDTPPVSEASSGCNPSANTCSNDSPNLPDQIENYMDYSSGSCQNMFTWGQKALMDLILGDTKYRKNLVSASNLVATGTDVITTPNCKPEADFSNIRQTICAGKALTFEDLSWGGTVTNRKWTFAGGTPSTSSDANPVVTYNTEGKYNVTLEVSNSAGQTTITRSLLVEVIPAIASIKTPLLEGFESNTFPPTNWEVSSNVANKNWTPVTLASASGAKSLRAEINASSSTTESYILDLRGIDLDPIGATDGYLNFKVAYAARPGVANERLRIFFSIDCGRSYVLLTQLTGSNLTTSAPFSGASFVPGDITDWGLISLKLNNINGANRRNVRFRFEALSNGGNSIYIDDINISNSITSIPILSKQDINFGVYPNPAANEASLSFSLPQEAKADIKVYDVAGRVVKDFGSTKLNMGTHTYNINKIDNNLTEGIYFIKVLINNTLYTEKIAFTQ
jgi:PKD repeat protein